MQRALATLSVACALASTPAHATGEIMCGNGYGASIDLLVGHVDVLSIARVTVTIGGKVWSSVPDGSPATPIRVGQAFEDENQLVLDLTDDAVNEVIARLRLFKLEEGDIRVTAGVLSVKGEGAWAVECSEGE